MFLAVDAGNSNVVLGVFASDAVTSNSVRPARTYRILTHPAGTPDELRVRIHSVLSIDGVLLTDLQDVVLASVVPAFTAVFKQAFPQARVIDHTWPFSFRIGTDAPSQTGIDRLVNAEAAVREARFPAILVDSGTATTLCALSADRVFLGGAILPGIEACRDALPSKAAQLFSVSLTPPDHAIGRNTDSALRSGVILGYASMIDGMVRRFRKEMAPATPRVIATGGTSRLLREVCTEIQELDPDLTLKGIAYLYASLRRG
jgi:type III pantothenate kinase